MKLILVALFCILSTSAAQAQRDPRVSDLLTAGEIRFGIFESQQISNVRPDIAKLLAERIGVRLNFIEKSGPVETIECLKAKECDAAFIHMDNRARNILAFSDPLIHYRFTLLVPRASKVTNIRSTNNPNTRVVGFKGHASTRIFANRMKRAQLIVVETPKEAITLLRSGRAEAIASTQHGLYDIRKSLTGSRILKDSYGINTNRIAIPLGNADRLAFMNDFVADIKSSGQLQKIVDRDKSNAGFQVSP